MILLVNLFLQITYASPYTDALQTLKCEKNMIEMRGRIERIVKTIPEHVKGMLKEDEVEAKIDFKEREVIFITLTQPQSLQSKVSYYKMYEDCAKLHTTLLNKPTMANLQTWSNCVEHGYGRDEIPEVFTFLRSCYSQLISN